MPEQLLCERHQDWGVCRPLGNFKGLVCMGDVYLRDGPFWASVEGSGGGGMGERGWGWEVQDWDLGGAWIVHTLG